MTMTLTAKNRSQVGASICWTSPIAAGVAAATHARQPVGLGWLFIGALPDPKSVMLFAWLHLRTKTQVLSVLNFARLPRSGKNGPQWHISVTDRTTPEPQRASSAQVALARCAFGLLEAEEDNHHPGRARHFWMPIDPSERVDCECKTDEVLVKEPDGYQWTNAVDGECRGCEHEREMAEFGLVRPCPLHAERRSV